MKKIQLTQNKFTVVDDEDFEWLSQWKWVYGQGYAVRNIYIKGSGKKHQKNITILMHSIINKTPKGFLTDHINRDKLDNRRSNLRTVTASQNTMNSKLNKTNTSGFRGVSFDKWTNSWKVRIRINYKVIHLGRYKNIIEAASVYKNASEKYFGEYA